jgi:hypothetical protein
MFLKSVCLVVWFTVSSLAVVYAQDTCSIDVNCMPAWSLQRVEERSIVYIEQPVSSGGDSSGIRAAGNRRSYQRLGFRPSTVHHHRGSPALGLRVRRQSPAATINMVFCVQIQDGHVWWHGSLQGGFVAGREYSLLEWREGLGLHLAQTAITGSHVFPRLLCRMGRGQ